MCFCVEEPTPLGPGGGGGDTIHNKVVTLHIIFNIYFYADYGFAALACRRIVIGLAVINTYIRRLAIHLHSNIAQYINIMNLWNVIFTSECCRG